MLIALTKGNYYLTDTLIYVTVLVMLKSLNCRAKKENGGQSSKGSTMRHTQY